MAERAVPARSVSAWREAILGAAIIGVGVLWALDPARAPLLGRADNFAYWSAWQAGLYAPNAQLTEATYIYSPAFAQLLWPATLLPYELFRWLWVVASWAAMGWLLWPLRGAVRVLALALAFWLCLQAKADWLIAVMLSLGLRYPAAWSIGLLTKVTPGIGLLWFAVRREWRPLFIALATTAAIVAISVVVAAGLWPDWLGVLARSSGHLSDGFLFGEPVASLLIRLPLAAALIVVGALRDDRWSLPLAVFLALPDIRGSSLLLLTAVPRLQLGAGGLAASRPRAIDDGGGPVPSGHGPLDSEPF